MATTAPQYSLGHLLFSAWLFSVAIPLARIFAVAQNDGSFDLDPVTNFCSRWFSQSIVKDDVLYIDSGLQKWNGTDISTPAFGINNYILKIPLKTSWDWKKDIVINAEPKNESNPSTGTFPQSLMRGHMFHGPANTSQVYLFGGTSYMGNTSFETFVNPDASTYALWTYDYETQGYPWNQYDISQPWRVNHGAAAEAIDQGLGFYLNGQIDWGTSVKTLNILEDEDHYRPLDGMLVIDLVENAARNISTPGSPRVGGSLDYLATVGGMGVLVALGGQTNQQRPWANSSEGDLVKFDSVDVFDIDSYLKAPDTNGTWYQQKTDGDIPPARIDFCTVTMSAADNSSYHIYLYGGRDPTQGLSYDDVYILSIPSFKWTPVFTDGGAPRHGHNCHLVGQRQMVTVGGNNTGTGECDWETKGVAFLDMTTVTWGSVYLTNTSSYGVPRVVHPATGGNAEGGATIKSPSGGWTDPSLETVFNTPRKWGPTPPPAEPRPKESRKTNVGAIAGGVVGGVGGLALLAAALFTWKRKRDKERKAHELESNETGRPRNELSDDKSKYELPGVNENNPAELPGSHEPGLHELNAPKLLVEADRTTSTSAAELSGETMAAGGFAGVPIVRTPGDDLPEKPQYSPGLTRRSLVSDANTTPSDQSPQSPPRSDFADRGRTVPERDSETSEQQPTK